jgi:hypothetical protein
MFVRSGWKLKGNKIRYAGGKEVSIGEEEFSIMMDLATEWLLQMHVSKGHTIPRVARNEMTTNDETATSTMDVTLNVSGSKDNNLWLGDSGASCHMCINDEGMFDCRMENSYIKVGNGKSLYHQRLVRKE